MSSTLLITGGTGSFGSAFLDKASRLTKFNEIRIFSRDEKKQDENSNVISSNLENKDNNSIDEKKNDRLTLSIREFNSYINSDKRTESLIIPVGDGLSVCRKL